ncbi:MAG: hypothetical protein EAZ74_02110 [Alphaproteobacteria bacterium]|nr:MAG: hypothetical protein EAY76_07170 [Alphaproteobacteria bacterium]TAF15319.1 MAG: hypothetical protein EAZ74_02110 [Alphaproteobacteria bacterium]
MLTDNEALFVYAMLNYGQRKQLARLKALELLNAALFAITSGEMKIDPFYLPIGEKWKPIIVEKLRSLLATKSLHWEKKSLFRTVTFSVDLNEGELPQLVDYMAHEFRKSRTTGVYPRLFFTLQERIVLNHQTTLLEAWDEMQRLGVPEELLDGLRYSIL